MMSPNDELESLRREERQAYEHVQHLCRVADSISPYPCGWDDDIRIASAYHDKVSDEIKALKERIERNERRHS